MDDDAQAHADAERAGDEKPERGAPVARMAQDDDED
jgi:hypothetical protein